MKKILETLDNIDKLKSIIALSLLIFGLGVLVGSHLFDEPSPPVFQTPQGPRIQSCFTLQHQCLPLLLKEIKNARREILVQASHATSPALSQALSEAHQKGIIVKILLDQKQDFSVPSSFGSLEKQGVFVQIDSKPRIDSNNTFIIDEHTLIGGSYTFNLRTENANAENVFILKDHPIVQQYYTNWINRAQVSRPFTSSFPQQNKKR